MNPNPIKLVARFQPVATASVVEPPLTAGQRVIDENDGCVRIETRLADTRVLRGWLLSFGPMVEVLVPAALRRAMQEDLKAAAKRYR